MYYYQHSTIRFGYNTSSYDFIEKCTFLQQSTHQCVGAEKIRKKWDMQRDILPHSTLVQNCIKTKSYLRKAIGFSKSVYRVRCVLCTHKFKRTGSIGFDRWPVTIRFFLYTLCVNKNLRRYFLWIFLLVVQFMSEFSSSTSLFRLVLFLSHSLVGHTNWLFFFEANWTPADSRIHTHKTY